VGDGGEKNYHTRLSEIVDGMGAGEIDSSHGMFYERLDGIVTGGESEERGITLLQT
jgi:hypothetical protein